MSQSNEELRREFAKFLNLKWLGYSNFEVCKEQRYQAMILYRNKKEFSNDIHFSECPNCNDWKDNFDNRTLNAEGTSEIFPYETDDEIVNLTPCNSEECREYRLMRAGRIPRNRLGSKHSEHVCGKDCCAEWEKIYREKFESEKWDYEGLDLWHDSEK
jgi:hypothetical protein